MRNKLFPILIVLLGALSFLLLVPQVWGLGLAFAIVGVIVGSATLKKFHVFSIIGVVLSITACIIYMTMMGASGASIFG